VVTATTAQEELTFPGDVPGWLTDREGYALYGVAQRTKGAVVELGAYMGRSTICLAQGAPVTTVDSMQGEKSPLAALGADVTAPILPGYEKVLRDNLARYGVADRVTVIVGDTVDVGKAWQGDKIGFLFIDADHNRAHEDFAAWKDHLLPVCLVAFDDASCPSVRAAITMAIKSERFHWLCGIGDKLVILERD
jgi:predicted O-methyltransferase YrrM